MENEPQINKMKSARKTLAMFSLASCQGCRLEMLNSYKDFGHLLEYFDIKIFRSKQRINFEGAFDIAIIEGNPDTAEQAEFLKKIRRYSNTIIAMGACAHLGGIQSERNFLPQKLTGKEKAKSVSDIIRVEYVIPGCPIDPKELYHCLMDLYWGKIFCLPDLSVCFECRQNGNKCLLRDNKLCLGPVTRGGCDSICVNNGEACFGCRGFKAEPNIKKLKEQLSAFMTEEEIENSLTIFGQKNKPESKLQ